ncbi:MAG: hypothetical protein E6K18_04330 [Methanobacteriota archaeon]|nr:MAG: hypothetical protein E6K18_04330 [Euryarchaeota archaeon]
MANLLEFDPNRDLTFHSDRDRAFDPGRKLLFDQQRDLGFNSDRGLPFGRRGVVFRGFICPICGAGVTEDQPTCTDCGAVFDPGAAGRPPSRPSAPAPPKPAPPPVAHRAPRPTSSPPTPPAHPPPPPVRAYPPTPKTLDFTTCPFCGARLAANDAFCWSCGNRMYAKGR